MQRAIKRTFGVFGMFVIVFVMGMGAQFYDDYLKPFINLSVSTPNATATSYRPPTVTPQPTPVCTHWSQITPEMEGRTICVYGTVYSLYSTNESWTRIKFTDAPNTFFINDTSYVYYELKVGDCISATQTIKLYGNVPYIEVSSVGLYNCNQ